MENCQIVSSSLRQTQPAKLNKPCPAARAAGPHRTQFVFVDLMDPDNLNETRTKMGKVFCVVCTGLMPVMSCAITAAGGSSREVVAMTGLVTSIPLALTLITLSAIKCCESCSFSRGYVVIDDTNA